MNRTHWQAIAIPMGTIATTVIAAEWRWEPASAGAYLVIVETDALATPDENAASAVKQRH